MVHPAIKAGNLAVITGAGYGGIGYALASTFASHKMRVALIDISSSDLSKASSELKLPEDDLLTIEADVSKYEDMLSAAEKVKEKFGDKGISVLCLNAGVGESGATTWNGKVDTWTKTLGVNLFGVINGSNAFTGSLVDSQNPGFVIVTGSKQGITAPPGTGAYYNVSKAGVKTFAERLAHELREATQKRVTAHLLVPGWTFTKLTKGSNTEKPAGAWEPQQVVNYALPRIEKGDFYIICPDNETSEKMDQARMEWSSSDVVQNRSALSRWDAEYKDEFEAFVKQRTG